MEQFILRPRVDADHERLAAILEHLRESGLLGPIKDEPGVNMLKSIDLPNGKVMAALLLLFPGQFEFS